MYETMITALKEQSEDPKEAQAYLDKQIAHTERINREALKQLEDQYEKKYNNIGKDLKELQLENCKIREESKEQRIDIERREKECELKLQEAALTHREQSLKIKLLEDEKEQLKKELSLLHQKLRDQNEISAIKRTRLEEKLKFRESMDQNIRSTDGQDLSVLSISVPQNKGFGRSQSPTVQSESKIHMLQKQHRQVIKEYKQHINEKDDLVKELCLREEEYIMKINELEHTIEYLNEQLDLVHHEKETSEQLFDTKLKRQENEYLQKINILDSEKQNARNMLSRLQHIIKSGDTGQESIVKKLNFSICLNNSESNPQLTRFHTLTTPCSPARNFDQTEYKSSQKLYCASSRKNLMSNSKCRSRNPSNSGLKLIANSIPIKNMRTNNGYKEMHQSGNFKTLKELGSARNLHVTTNLNGFGQTNSDGLSWFEKHIEHNPHENGYTLDSSQNNFNKEENMYKRSNQSKSKVGKSSDGGKGSQQISEIHPSRKTHSEDVSGTLMNSIVNLFPNKFKSKQGSGSIPQDVNIPSASFNSSPQGSLSKKELQEKLMRIKKSREGSRIQQLRDSSDSNDMNTDSPNSKIQMPYDSTNEMKVVKPLERVIDNESYYQMLETRELMKNINGDVLCKKCNREFSIEQLITDLNHWKLCLKTNPFVEKKIKRILSENPNCRMKMDYSEDDEEESDEYVNCCAHPDDNRDDSASNRNSSMLLINNDAHQQDQNCYQEDDESYEDEDGEYEDDIEEGVAGESDQDINDLYSNQHRNNRYACPTAILETVEQDSDECKSSICDSTNYVSQPKMFAKDKQVTKPPSLRYFSQCSEINTGDIIGSSMRINNQVQTQPQLRTPVKQELSQRMFISSLESKNSKGSFNSLAKKKSPRRYNNNEAESSVRIFSDITHKLQEDNMQVEKRRQSHQQEIKSSQIQKCKQKKQKIILCENIDDLDESAENGPIGYAEIDLMNNQVNDSDSDPLPQHYPNSKLNKLESTDHYFYEKMHENYLRDATPDAVYSIKGYKNQNNKGFQDYVVEDEYNTKKISRAVENKVKSRQALSRNNSGYGQATNTGMNRYNSMTSQNSNSGHQYASRSFALHL